jgi:hypothetical protein
MMIPHNIGLSRKRMMRPVKFLTNQFNYGESNPFKAVHHITIQDNLDGSKVTVWRESTCQVFTNGVQPDR